MCYAERRSCFFLCLHFLQQQAQPKHETPKLQRLRALLFPSTSPCAATLCILGKDVHHACARAADLPAHVRMQPCLSHRLLRQDRACAQCRRLLLFEWASAHGLRPVCCPKRQQRHSCTERRSENAGCVRLLSRLQPLAWISRCVAVRCMLRHLSPSISCHLHTTLASANLQRCLAFCMGQGAHIV